jgi:hypothetical protein
VDGRPGPNFGVILQHPLLDQLNEQSKERVDEFSTTEYRITPDQLRRIAEEPDYRFMDPLAKAPGGEAYAGEWIAAVDRVQLPTGLEINDDMIVLVQERFAEATAPVKVLGSRLKREGLWALGGVIGVVIVLWYVVIRVLDEPRLSQHRQTRATPSPGTVVSALTVEESHPM